MQGGESKIVLCAVDSAPMTHQRPSAPELFRQQLSIVRADKDATLLSPWSRSGLRMVSAACMQHARRKGKERKENLCTSRGASDCSDCYEAMVDDEAALNAEDEEDSVPTDVIEALPRRTFVRFFRQAAPCAICLDEPTTGLILVRLPCRHEFCEPCITEWLKRKNACPQCRAPIQT